MILLKCHKALLSFVWFTSAFSFAQNLAVTCEDISNAEVDRFCIYKVPSIGSSENSSGGAQTPEIGTELGTGLTTITFEATDIAGNTDSCETTFEVRDVTPPEVDCAADRSVKVDENCEARIPIIGSVSDNCDRTPDSFQDPQVDEIVIKGTTMITYYSTDEYSNSASCSTEFTAEDATLPEVTCIDDRKLYVDDSCEVILPAIGSASDNCDIPSTEQDPAEGTLVGEGTISVTFIATDESNNEDRCVTNFEVLDEIAPEVTCIPGEELIANDSCQARIPDIGSASDNCDSVTSEQSPRENAIASKGRTTVNYVATDGSGNEASCETDVEVVDITPPEVTCIRDQEFTADDNCEAIVPNIGRADDNCDIPIGSQTPSENRKFTGETTVTYTAMDDSSNIATCSTNIVAVDRTSPLVTCIPNQDLQVDTSCQARLPGIGSASDNCGDPEEGQEPAVNTPVTTGRTRVTYIATDDSGNTAQCATNFNVVDESAPEVTCIPDQEVRANDRCEAIIPPIGNAFDNCDTPDVSQSPRMDTIANIGATEVTFTAEDNSGNSASCSTTIRVVDDVFPSVDCIADQEIEANDNCEGRLPQIGTATDNCGILRRDQSPFIDTFVPLGFTTATYTAEDESGNTASCSTRINVVDKISPLVTCSPPLDIFADENCRARIPDIGTASDNCEVRFNNQNPTKESVVTLGDYPTSYSATDSSGNIGSCDTVVSVLDNTPPLVTCIEDETRYVDNNCETIIPTIGIASDNCGETFGIQEPREGTIVTEGESFVAFTATDGSGYRSSCTTLITVQDNIAPEVVCIEPREFEADGNCGATVPDILSSGRDNCGTPLGEQSPSARSTVNLGVTKVDYVLTDNAGNTASCTTPITVVDRSAPSVTCFAEIELFADSKCEAEIPSAGTASDNCEFDTSQSPSVDTKVPVGNTVVTFIAFDQSGNRDSCETFVTVKDITPPEVICPKELEVQANGACEAVIPEIGQVDDNCGNVAREQSPPPGTRVTLGETVITLTGTDTAGNSIACNTIFTVVDTRTPAVQCIPDTTIEVDEFCLAERISIGTASDNCRILDSSQDLPVGTYVGLGTEEITLTALDINTGETVSCTTDIRAIDATPPVQDDQEPICLWPPNKDYYCEDLDTLMSGTDNCGPVDLTYVHCGSEHKEYVDPCHHLDDCFLNEGRVCFRAGNLGTFQTSYTLAAIVADSSGNEAVFEREIYVPVNGSDVDFSQCINATESFAPFYDEHCGKGEPEKTYNKYEKEPSKYDEYHQVDETSHGNGTIGYTESKGGTEASSKGENGGNSKGGTRSRGKGGSGKDERGNSSKGGRNSRKGKGRGRGKNDTNDSRGDGGRGNGDDRERSSDKRGGKTGGGRNKRTGRGRGKGGKDGNSDDSGLRGRASRKGRGSRS